MGKCPVKCTCDLASPGLPVLNNRHKAVQNEKIIINLFGEMEVCWASPVRLLGTTHASNVLEACISRSSILVYIYSVYAIYLCLSFLHGYFFLFYSLNLHAHFYSNFNI